MLLILTMISGIREVLTPGAWRRQGSSYRLNDPSQESARRRSLEQLRASLDSVNVPMTPALRDDISALSRTPPPATDRLEEMLPSA